MPPQTSRSPQWRLANRFSATTRRRFLLGSAAAASSIILSNCARSIGTTGTDDATEGSLTATSTANADNKTLYIYSWSSYIDPDVMQAFETKTGIKPIVDTYDSNEAMLAKLQAGGGNQYSIICPSDYMVTQMVDAEMLLPIDHTQLSGLDQLKPQWRNPGYDPNNAHSVPLAWGTTGFMYNPDKTGTTVQGWEYVFENANALTRQVTLLNDVREVFGGVLMHLGYSINSTDPAEIEAAYQALVDLKPAIAAFMSFGWEDQLSNGDTTISQVFSVDAIALADENPNLTYITPATGTSLWTDTIAIPKTAPNPTAAYEWINFMLAPENSVGLVERLKFATPNQAVFEQLSADLKSNTNLFPPDDILAKCQGLAPLPQEAANLYDRYWTQLTSS
ncbi:ABC transporter substrate-binding protein [Thermocoleostomius sinensis]|uniref:Spermidine/putrescine ABC transporter substrate-binding protein n=1 Tax=Thermocoleostomius sinensis A174 TaxID=2016057 RepID=A0A9E8ZI49_9CYAN|nr:spermidine/putrescine ABC transporter substrate-binding protein [Thermocoleostomius sinensis]WAL62142.1 spermidine/putrescine ABC transporter substrate-binding protein [Thermocoleostomius sinensis A174]